MSKNKNKFLDSLKSLGVGILSLIAAIGLPILFGETWSWACLKYPETTKYIVIGFFVILVLILVYELGKEIRKEF